MLHLNLRFPFSIVEGRFLRMHSSKRDSITFNSSRSPNFQSVGRLTKMAMEISWWSTCAAKAVGVWSLRDFVKGCPMNKEDLGKASEFWRAGREGRSWGKWRREGLVVGVGGGSRVVALRQRPLLARTLFQSHETWGTVRVDAIRVFLPRAPPRSHLAPLSPHS